MFFALKQTGHRVTFKYRTLFLFTANKPVSATEVKDSGTDIIEYMGPVYICIYTHQENVDII